MPTSVSVEDSGEVVNSKSETTLTDDWRSYYLPGGWLGRYVEWCGKTTHAPPLFHVAAGLAWSAFELARRGWVLEGTNHKAPGLWFAIIAESGEGKGTAIRRIQRLAGALEGRLPSVLHDTRLKDSAPVLGVHGSPEGVMHELEHRVYDAPDGSKRACAFLVSEEFHAVLEMARKNSIFLDYLIQAHDQVDIQIHQRGIQRGQDQGTGRVRKGSLPHPALSTMFVSTREQMEDVFHAKHVHGGFASRFLWLASPPGWNVFWPREPDQHPEELGMVADAYVSWLSRVGHPDTVKRIVLPTNGPVNDAVCDWARYVHDNHPKGSHARALYVPRVANMTGTMACVIAAIETWGGSFDGPVVVSLEHYELARSIACAVCESLASVLEITDSKELRAEKDLMTALKQAGTRGLTTMQVRELLPMGLLQLSAILKVHAEHKVIVSHTVRGSKPGRPATYWWLSKFAPTPTNVNGREVVEWTDYVRHLNRPS